MVQTDIEHRLTDTSEPKTREYVIENPLDKGYDLDDVEDILENEGWNRVAVRKKGNSPQYKYHFDDDLEVNGELRFFMSEDEIRIEATGKLEDDSVPAGKRKLSKMKMSVVEKTLKDENPYDDKVWNEFYLEHRLPKGSLWDMP